MPANTRILEIHDFRGAWEIIKSEHHQSFKELEMCLNIPFRSFNLKSTLFELDEYFHDILFKNLENEGWRKNTIESGHRSSSGLGISHDGLTVLTTERMKTEHSTWLIERIMLLHAQKLSDITILLLPIERRIDNITFTSYENRTLKRFIKLLDKTLVSVIPVPFIIAGYGIPAADTDTCIFHKIDSGPEIVNNPAIIDKSIEFPPELYEAGRGILSYFGTYLNEKYADQKASIKIEQDSNAKTLRMTVVSETGDKEVIEKAYEEYKLMISGQELPPDLNLKDKIILDLRNELRIAKIRIESHLDARMIAEGQTDDLMKLLSQSISQPQAPVTIYNNLDVKATATATAEANQNLSLAIGGVAELKELMPPGSAEAEELEQLEQGLENIAEEQDLKKVQRSPAMNKFKRILEKIKSGEGKLAKAVEKAENGYEVFKDLATTYNKIADWCGLPHVPGVLIK